MMYDIIGKLEELESAGSVAATQLLDQLRNQNSPENERRAYQKFEREVLEKISGPDFELISHQEFLDLERILKDRHRCAHPSMASGFEPYAMSAEQARAHLRNAITCLLKHAPAQGTFALQRIWTAIESDLFPVSKDAAVAALGHGPLAHPRPVLVKNVVNGLVTSLLGEDRTPIARSKQFAALAAVRSMHPLVAEAAIATKLVEKIRILDDGRMDKALEIVARAEGAWELLDGEQRRRLTTFINVNIGGLTPELTALLMTVEEFRQVLLARPTELPIAAQGQILETVDVPEIIETAIAKYESSVSFKGSLNNVRDYLFPVAKKLRGEHLIRILNAYLKNDQIFGGWKVAGALANVVEQAPVEAKRGVPDAIWENVLNHLDELLDGEREPGDKDALWDAVVAARQV